MTLILHIKKGTILDILVITTICVKVEMIMINVSICSPDLLYIEIL